MADLARAGAAVEVTAVVSGDDPRPITGRFADQVVVRLDVRRVVGRGFAHDLRTPVLLIGGTSWADVELGGHGYGHRAAGVRPTTTWRAC